MNPEASTCRIRKPPCAGPQRIGSDQGPLLHLRSNEHVLSASFIRAGGGLTVGHHTRFCLLEVGALLQVFRLLAILHPKATPTREKGVRVADATGSEVVREQEREKACNPDGDSRGVLECHVGANRTSRAL